MKTICIQTALSMLIGCFILCCSYNVHEKNILDLFSSDKQKAEAALKYCICNRTSAEQILISKYSDEEYNNQKRIIFALGYIGGENSVRFLCNLIITKTQFEKDEMINILGSISGCISQYDYGLYYLKPDSSPEDYPRSIVISEDSKLQLEKTMDLIETRAQKLSQLTKQEIELISQIRHQLLSLQTVNP